MAADRKEPLTPVVSLLRRYDLLSLLGHHVARDDFKAAVKDTLARRVGYRCSNPHCRNATSGPHSDVSRFVNIGVACHITAAAQRGPRYDAALSADERMSIENAIWLCQTCSKLIDSDTARYPTSLLRSWKVEAEATALRALDGTTEGDFYPQPPTAGHAPIPKIAGLSYDAARSKLIHAGWQPHGSHRAFADNPEIDSGLGPLFLQRGYYEIVSASGTGLAHCQFAFQDIYGMTLYVVTAGEESEDEQATARVWRWYLATA